MIFEPQNYKFIFQDGIYSMAVGFIVGFVNQLLSVFLYKGRIKVFIRDILISVFFTTVLFSYCVSFTNYGVLRWYNCLFALAGRRLFSPCFGAFGNFLLSAAAFSTKNRLKKAAKSSCSRLKKNFENKQKFTPESTKEPLKDEDNILYN